MNFVNELYKHSILSMPNKVTDFYNSWNEYLTFREYYLNTQTSRNYMCSFVEYIEAYVINRRAYYRNQSLYDEHLLDDEKEFSKGELIVLNDNVSSAADPFHLIKVGIDINREEYKTYTVLKGNKEVNTFETNLKSFARENLALSSSAFNEEKL